MANPFEAQVLNPFQALLYGQQSYDSGVKRSQENAKRSALQALMSGGGASDPNAVANTLLSSGDTSGAATYANLAQTIEQRKAQAERDARDFKFRQDEAQRTQRNADRSYALQQRQLGATLDGQKIPVGFMKSPEGGLTFIPGGPADPTYKRNVGDRQNAPSGYRWNDPNDPSKGMVAIPGGPGEKVDAEVAGRLGLAKSFLGQLPEIKKRVAAGELTGIVDAAQAYAGMGGPGELRRQIDSGAEALLRMLTGAGMNLEEARQYTRRYQFSPTDKAETMLSKLGQLERELNSVGETVGRGRGGWSPPTSPPPGGIAEGATATNPQTGAKIMFRNGQWVPAQ